MKAKDIIELLNKNPEAEVCISMVDDEKGESYSNHSVVRVDDGEEHYENDFGNEEYGTIIKLFI